MFERRIAMVFLVGAFVFVALHLGSGCCPKYPHCKNDEHCTEHSEYCVDQVCRECAVNKHCQEKYQNACLHCTEDLLCATQSGCCRNDMECPNGGVCRHNSCVQCPGGCPAGKQCVAGRCQWKCKLGILQFNFNSSQLSEETESALDRVANCLQTMGVAVTVEGHTDLRGSEEYNQKLSTKHAENTREALVARGVDPDLLEAVGYGETRPVCTEEDDACHSRNRRVEFRINQ